MATTSPAPLVTAVRRAARAWTPSSPPDGRPTDGEYTGELDGADRLGSRQARGRAGVGRRRQVDLRSSYAYSDSYYDAPLLDAVGNPVAVNPDVRLAALARLRGWPIRHLDLPEGVPKIAGRELQDVDPLPAATGAAGRTSASTSRASRRSPRRARSIVVFNHRSYFDGTVVGAVLGHDRPVVPLPRQEGGLRRPGHRRLRPDGRRHPGQPVVGLRRAAGGGDQGARGRRGHHHGAGGHDPARAGVLRHRAEGPLGRGPPRRGDQGAGIPVGLWGTEKVWPRSSRLPGWRVDEPPEIRVRVGDAGAAALPQPRRRHQADHGRARGPAAADEARVSRTRRRPRSCAATYPPGYRGDPTREGERRPGTDT